MPDSVLHTIRPEVAKNGSITLLADGRFLHSKYNPEREAEQFITNSDCEYEPSSVFVLGACLSYCLPFLKSRFPKIPLYTIQYHSYFKKNTHKLSSWDRMFFCTNTTNENLLSEEIYQTCTEKELFAPFIISWNVADIIFKQESTKAWQIMENLLHKTKSVIATRSYFSKIWLKNTLRFFYYSQIKATFNLQIIHNSNILLLASGPSLEAGIPFIKTYKNYFYIVALSSALAVLSSHNIYPDFCVGTDGGYYAHSHLKEIIRLHQKGITIPLAVSTESAISSYILQHIPLLQLGYANSIGNILSKQCNTSPYHAERNGTVAGTALMLCLSLTTQKIFTLGLDLSYTKAYTHSQPNELELTDSLSDMKLHTLETRIVQKKIPTHNNEPTALEIYKQWFLSLPAHIAKRCYRIIPMHYQYPVALAPFIDVHQKQLALTLSIPIQKKYPLIISNTKNISKISIKKQKILPYLEKIKNSLLKKLSARENPTLEEEIWLEELAFNDYLLTKKYPKSQIYRKKLFSKIQKIFNDLESI